MPSDTEYHLRKPMKQMMYFKTGAITPLVQVGGLQYVLKMLGWDRTIFLGSCKKTTSVSRGGTTEIQILSVEKTPPLSKRISHLQWYWPCLMGPTIYKICILGYWSVLIHHSSLWSMVWVGSPTRSGLAVPKSNLDLSLIFIQAKHLHFILDVSSGEKLMSLQSRYSLEFAIMQRVAEKCALSIICKQEYNFWRITCIENFFSSSWTAQSLGLLLKHCNAYGLPSPEYWGAHLLAPLL